MLYDLKCEYKTSPIAIGVTNPRFSFKIKDLNPLSTPESFEIVVTDFNGDYVWNSGTLPFIKPYGIKYTGAPLKPLTHYNYKITLTDSLKNTHYNQSSFETGFFDISQWKKPFYSNINPNGPTYLREVFDIKSPIKSAKLFIAAAVNCFGDTAHFMTGYLPIVNGEYLSDERLNPTRLSPWSNRALYRCYNITHFLKSGENLLNLIFLSTAISYQIIVEFFDGKVETFGCNQPKVSTDGPYNFWTDVLEEHGGKEERYDALLDLSGWRLVNFDDSNWALPKIFSGDLKLFEQTVITKTQETFAPALISKQSDFLYFIDLGQNINGTLTLNFKGLQKGQEIKIKYSEQAEDNKIDPLTTINFARGESQPHTDIYIATGMKFESYTPLFSMQGFQYATVESNTAFVLDDVLCNFIYSDIKKPLEFSCSDKILNSLFEISLRSQKSNLVGIPTDCPHRERNGWLGDALMVCDSESIGFDLLAFYENWLDNILEDSKGGHVPDISPFGNESIYTRVDIPWASAIVVVPYAAYQIYGDEKILEKCYDGFLNWLHFLDSYKASNGVYIGADTWGDHLSRQGFNKDFIASAFAFMAINIGIKIAKIINRDSKALEQRSTDLKKAIISIYYSENGFGRGSQGENAIALNFNLTTKENHSVVLNNLLQSLGDDLPLLCGALGLYSIFPVLENEGFNQLILKILRQNVWGSFYYWITKYGATTPIESLYYQKGDKMSLNHPFLMGSLTSWLYRILCGICPITPGYEKFKVNPFIPEDIDFAKFKTETLYGIIDFCWKKDGDKIIYNLEIPVGSKAVIHNPKTNEIVKEITHGKYTLEF